MPIYKPSELRDFLNQLDIYPKKGLSQNFLIDQNIIHLILSVSGATSGDFVLEIGPGPGSLTEALLAINARVISVEKDEKLANALLRFQTEDQRLTVIHEDVLKCQIDHQLFENCKKKVKLISNLPYHLTTPILTRFVVQESLFHSMTVMVQEEVARRMTAQPGSKAYGSLSLFLQFYSTPVYAFTVSRNCFYPTPNVDSAVVTLDLHAPLLPSEDIDSFFELTRTAFKHRRKMLRASLSSIYPTDVIEKALTKLKLNPLSRPEMLSVHDFCNLFNLVKTRIL